MDLLLDTHVFLWWDADSSQLGPETRAAIADPANRIFVSAASIWEIGIKRRTGKLVFSGSAVEAIGKNGFVELAISGRDAEGAAALDWDHADPFDRLLVAQARAASMTLATVDKAIRRFGGVAQLSGE
jgi:PIN domain nuclease of toxin-antitoxin system